MNPHTCLLISYDSWQFDLFMFLYLVSNPEFKNKLSTQQSSNRNYLVTSKYMTFVKKYTYTQFLANFQFYQINDCLNVRTIKTKLQNKVAMLLGICSLICLFVKTQRWFSVFI